MGDATREKIAAKLLKDVEAALVRFKNAPESEKGDATKALERALDRHSEFVLDGKVPEELTRPN